MSETKTYKGEVWLLSVLKFDCLSRYDWQRPTICESFVGFVAVFGKPVFLWQKLDISPLTFSRHFNYSYIFILVTSDICKQSLPFSELTSFFCAIFTIMFKQLMLVKFYQWNQLILLVKSTKWCQFYYKMCWSFVTLVHLYVCLKCFWPL